MEICVPTVTSYCCCSSFLFLFCIVLLNIFIWFLQSFPFFVFSCFCTRPLKHFHVNKSHCLRSFSFHFSCCFFYYEYLSCNKNNLYTLYLTINLHTMKLYRNKFIHPQCSPDIRIHQEKWATSLLVVGKGTTKRKSNIIVA